MHCLPSLSTCNLTTCNTHRGMSHLMDDKIPPKGVWWGPQAKFVNFRTPFVNSELVQLEIKLWYRPTGIYWHGWQNTLKVLTWKCDSLQLLFKKVMTGEPVTGTAAIYSSSAGSRQTRTPLYQYVQFTPPKPHVSLHGPDSLSAIWLLIKQFGRRFRPSMWPTPTHSFLIVTLCKLFSGVPINV